MSIKNFYEELGLNQKATNNQIKSAYRLLVKKHHPDIGGLKENFLAIQLAWETLSDPKKKETYDKNLYLISSSQKHHEDLSYDVVKTSNNSVIKDSDIKEWIRYIYKPVNRMINQIIKPLNGEIQKLSADPYDDLLMEEFCQYILSGKKIIKKIEKIYESRKIPYSISEIGLDLYHCFSQVKDGLDELDKYTQGYVDDYLFDGREMIKEAKRIKLAITNNIKSISF